VRSRLSSPASSWFSQARSPRPTETSEPAPVNQILGLAEVAILP
jgi:hypothetical protein